jgi:aminoglycoside phosphotransferase family enzyme/predicted kinase
MTENVPFAAVRETHIGVVFLVGDLVYKLKKPVNLGFLDFSTPERRLAACRREVELNRRLAPDVYLGVAKVSDVDGAPGDHLVVMRRMPDDRRLSTLVQTHAPLEETVIRLARVLAAFHARAERGPHVDAEGTREALSDRWEASFAQVDEVAGDVLDPDLLAETKRRTRDFLAGRETLFAARILAGRIVDGHGDLLADDIFVLDDGPRVLDCLEFDDRLRRLDGLDDVAFLAMDLSRLGAPELGELLLDRYAEHMADPAPASLRAHYVAYRAFVRVKVACLRHAQGDASAAAEARAYADLAVEHLRRGEVRLVLVGGLPGSGKTTTAGLLADRLGAVLLSTDRVRKELAGLDPARHAAAPYRAGIYSQEHTGRTYAELLRRAEELLGRGESVVLDASWADAEMRGLARKAADRSHSAFVALRCDAPATVTDTRLRTRTGSLSDANSDIALAMAEDMAPWPEATVVDTAGEPAVALIKALRAVLPENCGL